MLWGAKIEKWCSLSARIVVLKIKRKVMNLRSILNRLTEEELELLQEEIEGNLYQEIDKVLDDKRQPSLFC